jgi:hypothetical protein
MEMPEKERMIKYYEDLYGKYGYDLRSLDWKDPAGQILRYSTLFSIVSMGKKRSDLTIADIGSGLGHFYGHLKAQGLLSKHKIKYTGYDISPKLVKAARDKFKEAKFEVKDILEGYFTEKFDYVFSCGVFNIRLTGEDEHYAFVKEMLLRMYESANLGVAVNFLSINGIYYVEGAGLKDSVYYYFNPEDIVRFVRSFASRFVLRHDYHVGDFTVYLFKG